MIKTSAVIILIFILITFSLKAQTIDTTKAERVNQLGVVNIVSQKTFNSVTRNQSLVANHQDVATALNQIPSVWFVNVGSRNESVIQVRGFDSRGVPVYIDGVPVYIPYDGLFDLGRFKTFGLSKIDISKGISPIAFGPNTLGGAINLVTLKPENKLEVQLLTGVFSGKGLQYGINVGSKLDKMYFQADYYHTQQDFFPLSKRFISIKNEDGGERNNSIYNDHNLHIKVGFTPKDHDEYSINASYQKGEKGTPPYAGSDALIKARFWQWPVWNKTSLYFLSNTAITKNINLKSRVYFDNFENQLNSYDDSTYSEQIKSYSFISYYSDYDLGGNLVLELNQWKKNKLSISSHFKNDNHSEHNEGESVRKTSDNTFSLGFDDLYNISDKINIVSGLSFNNRTSSLAQNYFSANDSIGSFEPFSNNAVNAQIGVNIYINHKLYFKTSIAHKTRFSTMKERYSYKMSKAIPNPELLSEQATHYEISANYNPIKKIGINANLFYINIIDVIQNVDNVQPGLSQLQNTGLAEFKGLDLELRYNISKVFTAYGNYSLISRKNINKLEIYFTDIPRDKLYFALTIKPVKNLIINANTLYYGERYSTSYGTLANPFNVVNLSVSYKFKIIQISVGINNILDENYSYSEGYPDQGRNYFATIMYNFEKK